VNSRPMIEQAFRTGFPPSLRELLVARYLNKKTRSGESVFDLHQIVPAPKTAPWDCFH